MRPSFCMISWLWSTNLTQPPSLQMKKKLCSPTLAQVRRSFSVREKDIYLYIFLKKYIILYTIINYNLECTIIHFPLVLIQGQLFGQMGKLMFKHLYAELEPLLHLDIMLCCWDKSQQCLTVFTHDLFLRALTVFNVYGYII